MKYCHQCGSEFIGEGNFCPWCRGWWSGDPIKIDHFVPAPRKLTSGSAPLKTKHIIKQPGPMRRGNRI